MVAVPATARPGPARLGRAAVDDGSPAHLLGTRGRLLAAGDDPRAFLDKHLVNIVVGMGLCVLVAGLGYRTLRALTPWLYAAAILVLLAVLSPLGTVQNGIQAWIVLPAGFSLQPSELAKVAVVTVVALALTHRVGRSGLAPRGGAGPQ